jgi:hypothetical protein
MSDLTTNLDQVSQSVSQREVQINALLDAAAPATIFGRRASTCAALVFGYYGGRFNGTSVSNGTVTATDDSDNYVVVHRTTLAVTVATATTNWNNTAVYARAYKLVAADGAITDYEDHRAGIGGVAQAAKPYIVLAPAYASTVTVDLTNYTMYQTIIVDLTLTGDVTFNITNGTDGQAIKLRVRQDGAGNRIWTSGANLRFGADITSIVLSTAASKLDYIGFEWNGTDTKADVLATNLGF